MDPGDDFPVDDQASFVNARPIQVHVARWRLLEVCEYGYEYPGQTDHCHGKHDTRGRDNPELDGSFGSWRVTPDAAITELPEPRLLWQTPPHEVERDGEKHRGGQQDDERRLHVEATLPSRTARATIGVIPEHWPSREHARPS